MSKEEFSHKLPPLLEKLVDDNEWGYTKYLPLDALNKILLRAGLPPIEHDVEMGLSSSQDEDTSMYSPAEKEYIRYRYSIASSRDLGQKIEDEGILDIHQAVFIAGSGHDYICLDYRENPDNPCVRAYVTGDDEWIVDWRMIAPDFETFARDLGLVE